MGKTTAYPDGSSLVSSALTLAQINAIIQPLTMSLLGYAPDPTASFVRVEYPTLGAPFQEVTEDICYLSCMLADDPYDKIRDKAIFGAGAGGLGWGQGGFGAGPYGGVAIEDVLTEATYYTRVWRIHWTAYGPNSLDNLRALRSGLYQDLFTDLLSLKQLFPVSEFSEVVRVPEEFNGQWCERCDVECEMYEFVTESIQRNTIGSVEVIASTSDGQFADITVEGD
jgi:hypothetical protein